MNQIPELEKLSSHTGVDYSVSYLKLHAFATHFGFHSQCAWSSIIKPPPGICYVRELDQVCELTSLTIEKSTENDPYYLWEGTHIRTGRKHSGSLGHFDCIYVLERPVVTLPTPPQELGLVQASVRDAERFLEPVCVPDISRKFATLGEGLCLKEERDWIYQTLRSEEDILFKLISLSDPSQKALGIVGIHKIHKPSRQGRIGVIVGPGNGWGEKALRLICEYAFRHEDFNKLWLMHFADNDRMSYLTEKVGFLREAVLQEEYVDGEGKFHDMIRCCLFSRDWTS